MDVNGIASGGLHQKYDVATRKDATAVSTTDERTVLKNGQEINTSAKDDDHPMSEKEQQHRMERLQETLKNHNIEISYNDEVNRYSIKVLDSDSKEVVKEIPSEKTLEMFAKMLEIEGLLVDEKR